MDHLRTIMSRTDWGRMRRELAALHNRLQFEPHRQNRVRDNSPSETLRAYSEGKLTLGEAIMEIERWKNRKVAEALTRSK